jgi:hypothetical protein
MHFSFIKPIGTRTKKQFIYVPKDSRIEKKINGKQIGKMNTDNYATVIWKDVKLNPGKNLVEIITADGNDSAEWTVE